MPDQPDPMARIHALRNSLRAKCAAIPHADYNGNIIDEDDPDRPRYGAGLAEPIEPKPTTAKGERA